MISGRPASKTGAGQISNEDEHIGACHLEHRSTLSVALDENEQCMGFMT